MDNNVWGVWDATSEKQLGLVRVGREGRDGARSPDGTWAAAGGAQTGDTAVWKIAGKK